MKAVALSLWGLVSAIVTVSGQPKAIAPGILQVGTLQDSSLQESSGVIASRQHEGVFWTHNDGKKERLYAIDRQGKTLAQFRLTGIKVEDWEDIALDSENRLYIADTGNNQGNRSQVTVHRLAEPNPKSTGGDLLIQESWHLRFPAQPFDSEALFVHGGEGYLVSKVTNDRLAELYRFPLTGNKGVLTLALVGRIRIDSPVTAADISPNGKQLAVLAKKGAYLFQIDGDVAKAAQVTPALKRFKHDSMEACTFTTEGLFITAESRELFLFTDDMFKVGK